MSVKKEQHYRISVQSRGFSGRTYNKRSEGAYVQRRLREFNLNTLYDRLLDAMNQVLFLTIL